MAVFWTSAPRTQRGASNWKSQLLLCPVGGQRGVPAALVCSVALGSLGRPSGSGSELKHVRLLRVAGWGLRVPDAGGLWPAASWEQIQGVLNSYADINPCK